MRIRLHFLARLTVHLEERTAAEKVPAEHGLQTLEPTALAKVPTGQFPHTLELVTLVKVPVGHACERGEARADRWHEGIASIDCLQAFKRRRTSIPMQQDPKQPSPCILWRLT